MAIIAYDTPPTGPAELGPGTIRRQYRPDLYAWTGFNNPAPDMTRRTDFADMMTLAAYDWWHSLNASQRQLWYTWATNIHHRRPGNAASNTRRQPFSRFVTSAGYLGYWFLPNPITGPSIGTAHIDGIAISAFHATPQSLDIVVTIDATASGQPNAILDIYQLRPAAGLPWLSWHGFKLARHFKDIIANIHTYVVNVPLPHWQAPGSAILLWARLRNGQDANEFNLLYWKL